MLRHLADVGFAGDGLPPAEDRARLLATFVDRKVEFAVLTAQEDALEGLASGVERRTRSAAWTIRHRSLLVRAL